MFNRSYLLVAISLILIPILGACGSDKNDAELASPVSSPAAADTTTTRVPERTTTGGARSDQAAPAPSQVYLTTIEVVKILRPSIVQIATESLAMDFFNQPVPSRGVGTGVILDKQGNILTNNHVIAGAQRITVTLNNGDSVPGLLVGGDPTTDTAVVRIDASGLQPAKLGDSSALQVGEEVIAIGHALGLPGGPTVSKGVVSALGRSIDTNAQTTIVDLIQTDAAINPGNSGGALVNARAEVVGINTAIIQGSRGIGFAINIDDVKVVVVQLMEQGFVKRGFLGIGPVNLNAGIANQVGVPVTEGVLVARVVPGSAADQAGLRAEDVIAKLGDEPIRNTGELSRFLIAHLPGETVTIVFFRGEKERTTQIILGNRPPQ